MEPSQQLRSCHLPMGRYRRIPWDVIPGHAGRLTSSLHGGRPLVQLPSLLRLCKETSYLMAVLPCPSSAQQSSSAAEGEPCAPHPLLHTCNRAVGLHRGCQRATQRGAGVHHPPPAQQGCAGPEHVDGGSGFDTSPSSRRVPEEQQCLKPDSNLLLLSWYELLFPTKA